MRRGHGAAALAALTLSLAAAAPVPAHVHLTASRPADGARPGAPPAAVQLTFNRPVEERFAALTLFDARGGERHLEPVRRAAPNRLVVALPADAPHGQTVLAYRVLATDGHPVTGAITFVSATGRAAAAARGAAPIGRAPAAPQVASAALAGARGLQYGAIAIALGGAAFMALVWLPAIRRLGLVRRRGAERALAHRWRVMACAATAAGAASAIAALVAHAAIATGGALSVEALGSVAATRSGAAWTIAFLAWLAVAAVLASAGRQTDHPRILLALAPPLTVLALVPAASGHAGRDILLSVANVVHVAAVSVWLGGLAALALALCAARGQMPAALRGDVVARFSGIAHVAMAGLILSGGVQAALLLQVPSQLVTTGYGRLLSVKIAVTVLLLALGSRQRRGIGAGSAVVDAAIRLELALGLLVVATTALLAGAVARG